jgi:hypothetical protein
MAEKLLTLTLDEEQYLVGLIEHTLKNAQVEEHRTRTPSFREHVLRQEDIMKALLKKLGRPAE